MANVRKYLQDILDAIYGEEVRGSIHDAIEAMNEESTNAEAVAISSRDSAKHNAEAAEKSASEAAASETAAKTSETNAKASETAAKTSETNAKASETAAKRSENNASDSEEAAYESEQNAKASENAAKDSEDAAAASASSARVYSLQAFEYKHDAEDAATAAHQYEQQCEQIRDDIGYPIDPKGTVLFANLPAVSTAQIGWMYNISDDFTTTSDFEEGAGKFYSAGSEVYVNSNHKWSVMAGPGVTGIKGEAESNYRKGQINITKSMLGINTLDDIDTPSFSQATTRSNIENTDSVSTIFGKIKKFFADLKTVAFTGSYNDLADKPEHLGHSIKDATTTFTDRAGLKFTGNVSVSDDSTNDETIIDVEGKPDHFYATKEDMLDDIDNIGEGEMAYIEEESSDLLTRVENIEQDVSDAQEDIEQINSDLSSKQDKTDNSLATTSKTVVGAINELRSDLLTRVENIEQDVTDAKEDIEQINSDLSGLSSALSNKVSKGKVLANQGVSLTVGTSFTLSDSVDNYDYIIVEAYALVGIGTSRKFSTADFYASFDKGQSTRYIGLSHYYDATYHASVGFTVGSNGKSITVAERSVAGYSDIWGIMVVGINY